MSLSQWTSITNSGGGNGTFSFVEEIVDPIRGLKSLAYQGLAVGAAQAGITGYTATAITTQNGFVRTLGEFVTSGGPPFFGVFGLMQSPFTIAQNCYFVQYNYSGGTLQLRKGVPDATAGTSTVLNSVVVTSPSVAQVFAIMMEWQTDPITGDVHLDVWWEGPIASPSTYDYSTIVPQISYIDASSPYGAGVTAGVYGSGGGNGTGVTALRFDYTEIAIC